MAQFGLQMTDRIGKAFRTARAQGRIALAPFVTVGFPSPATTISIIRAVSDAGADLIELGVPFSDPLADGPTIQRSSFVALEKGVTPGSASKRRRRSGAPGSRRRSSSWATTTRC